MKILHLLQFFLISLYCFAFERNRTNLMIRFVSSGRFFLAPLIVSNSILISLVIDMNNTQHPIMNINLQISTPIQYIIDTHCVENTKKYTYGFFQSNGYLNERQKSIKKLANFFLRIKRILIFHQGLPKRRNRLQVANMWVWNIESSHQANVSNWNASTPISVVKYVAYPAMSIESISDGRVTFIMAEYAILLHFSIWSLDFP